MLRFARSDTAQARPEAHNLAVRRAQFVQVPCCFGRLGVGE